MTKPQKWVSAFLFLFIILFMLGKLTKEKDNEENIPMNNQMNTEEANSEITGEQLFASFGCTRCHGINLTGTMNGPELKNISDYWSKESLITYLRNPMSYLDEERFIKYREKFPQQIMPGFGNKNIKDLGKLADYLLNF